MIYLELFLTFFKIGLLTLGGGYEVLPIVLAEVEVHRWMDRADLLSFAVVSEYTSGGLGVNMSTLNCIFSVILMVKIHQKIV